MIKHPFVKYLCLILIPLAVGACQSQMGPSAAESRKYATETMRAAETGLARLHDIPPSSTPRQPAIITPRATLTLEPSPTATILHLFKPEEPPPYTSSMSDRSSALLADQNRTIGDHFDYNLYERPLTADEMAYVAYLDIAPGAELSLAPPWVYVTIYLVEEPPAKADAYYAVELDLDVDGRGDWLIIADSPSSSTWTTNGVRAYLDTNGDIGGKTPFLADPQPQPGDGFEVLFFDQGIGANPDDAWVRLAPAQDPAVQLAFRHELIRQDKTFIWSVWAEGDVANPAWFDYNDHFTVSQAGSPDINSRHYPLDELSLVDNTCHWVQGIVPRKGMPGLCGYVPPISSPTPRPNPNP
jgi:hypothetical protein